MPEPAYTPLYKTLPPTPTLPVPVSEGFAPVNNIKIWYGLYGPPLTCGTPPVVFLHGGKISARWWAHQIEHVANAGFFPVIAVDTRAHGRSTDDPAVPLSYDLFADDVAALLVHLGVPTASVVGWSDGANTSLALAMRHVEMVDRIFVFGANYNANQANVEGIKAVPFLEDLGNRMKSEYQELSATPERFDGFMERVSTMQAELPAWDAADFARIKTLYEDPVRALIVWIVSGDSEEFIQHKVAGELRDMIRGSSLVILPEAGHLAPLQDPETFNCMLDRWLSRRQTSQ